MIKLHIMLKGEENLDFITDGIKNNNKITYKENDVLVCINVLKNKIKMNRKCNEYEIDLLFEKSKDTISTYSVFGGLKKFDLVTKTKKLLITDDKIIVDYNLEGNDFKFILEVI